MKIYKDSSLKEEIKTLDLGVVDAGTTKEFSFYVLNDTVAKLENIVFDINNTEVAIKIAPSELKANSSGELVVAWSPSITLKKGLKTILNVKANEIYS